MYIKIGGKFLFRKKVAIDGYFVLITRPDSEHYTGS